MQTIDSNCLSTVPDIQKIIGINNNDGHNNSSVIILVFFFFSRRLFRSYPRSQHFRGVYSDLQVSNLSNPKGQAKFLSQVLPCPQQKRNHLHHILLLSVIQVSSKLIRIVLTQNQMIPANDAQHCFVLVFHSRVETQWDLSWLWNL